MKTKTKFCDRFFSLSPKICIYDLDGTIIDSSHRIKLQENGSLDLEHWKQNSTKEMIFQDNFIPVRMSNEIIGKKALKDLLPGKPIIKSDYK